MEPNLVTFLVENYKAQCLDTRVVERVYLDGDQTWGTGTSVVLVVEMCNASHGVTCASAKKVDQWRKKVKVFTTTAGNYVDFEE